jgi:hypothetical protein
MKKILFLIPIFIILVGIILAIAFNRASLSPSESVLEECNTISFTDENSINILFFSDKKNAERDYKFFIETPPYDAQKENFNFYYIDSYKPECETYREIAIVCDSKELIKKAASCPNDFIYVIKDADALRSSTKRNIVSLNLKHPLTVLTHETGHAVGNLADEYVLVPLINDARNCLKSCEEFASETDGCFEGCSEANLFRSISNGVMRTLNNNNYGIYNQKLILDEIKLLLGTNLITGNIIRGNAECEEQKFYLIESHLENGELIIDKTTPEKGCSPKKIKENLKEIFTDSPGTENIEGDVFKVNDNEKIYITTESEEFTNPLNQEIIKISPEELNARPCRTV